MSRRNPFEEIERMFERMNRQFGELSQGEGSHLPTPAGGDRKSVV